MAARTTALVAAAVTSSVPSLPSTVSQVTLATSYHQTSGFHWAVLLSEGFSGIFIQA